MGEAYPELAKRRKHVERVLEQEEERFAETLATGMALLEERSRRSSGKTHRRAKPCSSSTTPSAFPVDLTADIARERGLKIDEAGFESGHGGAARRARARRASSASTAAAA